MPETPPDYRAFLLQRFPELAGSTFTFHTRGFHSIAVDVDDAWIFKFPRSAEAARALRREAQLLAAVRPAVRVAIPELTLFEVPSLFSRHRKLPGAALERADYEALPKAAKVELGSTLANFYADLHALDIRRLETDGATPVEAWGQPDRILRDAWPLLPDVYRDRAAAAVRAFEALPPDPLGDVFGYFDGHGWNMAFDHRRGQLHGIFDFADAGIGPLHREFIHANFVSFDLAERIARDYERLTRRSLDRERIFVMTGFLWLAELGGFAGQPDNIALALEYVSAWMSRASRHI